MFVLSNTREQLKARRPAWITYALILINILVFVITSLSGSGTKELAQLYGNRPAEPSWWTFFSSMFLHIDILPFLCNVLILYVTGSVLEGFWGKPLFLSFYLTAGILATTAFDAVYTETELPLFGASGAVSALVGAFLVRLRASKVPPFYIPGLRITEKLLAPAWLVLPLWIVLQTILYTFNLDSGAALAAQIAGFLFGVVFSIGMALTNFEQKFLTISTGNAENRKKFLAALKLSKQEDYVQAMELLKQVISVEPDHLEAFMELRKIAEIVENREANSQYTGALLEMLVRKNETDLIHQVYTDYMHISRSKRNPLPIKALYAVASFMEMVPDYRNAAVEVFGQVIEWYPQDLLSLKAITRIAQLYIDRFDNRKKGVEILMKAYQDHQNPEWRKLLQAEFKRYNIQSPEETASLQSQTATRSDPSLLEPNLLEAEPAGELFLPDEAFDGNRSEWDPVPCWIERIEANGVMLRNDHHVMGLLPWEQVKFVSVGRVKIIPAGAIKPEKDYLVLDLILEPQGGQVILYRTSSQRFYFKKIFPGLELNSSDGYNKMINAILNSSRAVCVPNREKCLGPAYSVFSSLNHYETQLKAVISSQG